MHNSIEHTRFHFPVHVRLHQDVSQVFVSRHQPHHMLHLYPLVARARRQLTRVKNTRFVNENDYAHILLA